MALNKKPLISTIIPIYNVESYLSQTIDSIIRQNIGFEDNVELILVNDGSPDNSEKICLEYRDRYPSNIIYLKQKNTGVSAARNLGAKSAKGKYIHFMDSDDIISKNFYRESVNFLEENNKTIDFVASKIKYFDAKYTDHYLNNKFKTTHVIDVMKEPKAAIFHVSSILFIRKATAAYSFDTKLKVAEDAKYVNEILHQKKSYGVLSNTVLYYRKRSDNSSAISSKLTNKSYFIDTPVRFLDYLVKLWSEDGRPLPYIQNLVMNDIAWKISEEKSQSILSKDEENAYKHKIYELALSVDDGILLSNTILNIDQKAFLLRKKYGPKAYQDKLIVKNNKYFFDTIPLFIYDWGDESALVLDFIHDQGGGVYRIEGYAQRNILHDEDERYIVTSKGKYKLKPVARKQRRDGFLGDIFTDNEAFEVTIEVGPFDMIKGLLTTYKGEKVNLPIFTKQFTGMGVLDKTYHQEGGIIFRKNHHTIEVYPNTRRNRILSELRFDIQVLRNIQLRQVLEWLKGSLVNSRSLLLFAPPKRLVWEFIGPVALLLRSAWMGFWDVLIRFLYFAGLYKSKRPIWLISDRGRVAGDNGEALYRYILENESPDVDIYFAISKKSSDYERIKKVGKVVDIDSFKYKMLFLHSSKIISSHADYYVYNAFGYRWTHLNDLYKFDYIFLQHGIIKDDLSDWLNRFEKNITIFVTSAKREYESIINGDYGYTKEQVKLTGLPRYDLLENDPKGILMLAPTWRQNLLPEERHGNSGIRAYSDTFINTEYYQFYNGIMNDTRILSALKAANMKGELFLHPAFSRQAGDFKENSHFKLKKLPYDYTKAFAQSDILVTDYSSVAFDFAYLRKPVIYTQFDVDTVYENHIADKGYFSYEKDGFGPVLYDYDSAIQAIIEQIEHGSTPEKSYIKRVDSFFAFNDSRSRKRVYSSIQNLDS